MTARGNLRKIDEGKGRTVLVVVPHADDLALFIGGTVALWAQHGWRVVVARVTDDARDSYQLSLSATIEANHAEFRAAAALLGVAEVIEYGFPTDTLGDVSEVALRERIIHSIRLHRPYALVGLDQFVHGEENNQDHWRVAAATAEAFWTSQFDLHHPEHFEEGLAPHGCFEQWYFGRGLTEVTDVVDVSSTLETKVAASCAHQTMMRNFFRQIQLQAATGGWRILEVDECLESGDVTPLLGAMMRAAASRVGEAHGLPYAEEFRIVTFNGLESLLAHRGRSL